MNLSKRDALFLYKTLFHFSETQRGFTSMVDLENFIDKLEQFLLPEEDSSESDDDDDDVRAEEDQLPEPDATLSISNVSSLPSLNVTTPDGSKATLEFEDVGEDSCVDALIDGGDVIVDHIVRVRASKATIDLFDGEEWHSYGYKRLPKQWASVFSNVDFIYDIEAD